jgi:hypothetical protein
LQELVVAGRERREPQVGDAAGEVFLSVRRLTALELAVERQCGEPRFRGIAERADRLARVREKKPGSLLVIREHFRHAVRPAGVELGRETRLERLNRRACFEPDDPSGERHAQHRGPRALVHGLDRADRLHARADPLFDGERMDHDSTMSPDEP